MIDGHEDISMNALPEGRDYLTSAHAIRETERQAGFENPNGVCMLGLPDWLAGHVGIIMATIATIPRTHANPGELSYPTIEGARQQALAHLDLYRRWESIHRQIEIVRDRSTLDAIAAEWLNDSPTLDSRRVGFVLLMENADPIRCPDDLEFWFEQGVRMIGPAWHANRFTGDTKSDSPLTDLGRELLKRMSQLGFTLDLTHMSESASLEALATYDGRIIASHANSRRTVDYARLLSDQVVRGIVERDGIVGVMPLNWALVHNWERGADKSTVTLDAVVDAIEAVCDIAGDCEHVGIGSDFDGGQGAECVPREIDTVADLGLLADALSQRGYGDSDVECILYGNWLNLIRRQFRP
ncbi:MAG: membrane dipeptidase [Nitrolancea sp.]